MYRQLFPHSFNFQIVSFRSNPLTQSFQTLNGDELLFEDFFYCKKNIITNDLKLYISDYFPYFSFIEDDISGNDIEARPPNNLMTNQMVFDDIDELLTDDRKTCAVVAKHLQRNWDAYEMARKAIGIKENHGEDMKSKSKLV